MLNKLNQMWKDNSFVWTEVDDIVFGKLPSSTQEYLSIIGKSQKNIICPRLNKILVANIGDGTIIFKLEHPTVKYLVHIPNTSEHMWGDENFDNINNNLALAMLYSKNDEEIPAIKKFFDNMDAILS